MENGDEVTIEIPSLDVHNPHYELLASKLRGNEVGGGPMVKNDQEKPVPQKKTATKKYTHRFQTNYIRLKWLNRSSAPKKPAVKKAAVKKPAKGKKVEEPAFDVDGQYSLSNSDDAVKEASVHHQPNHASEDESSGSPVDRDFDLAGYSKEDEERDAAERGISVSEWRAWRKDNNFDPRAVW